MKAENKPDVFAIKIFLLSFLFCMSFATYAQQKNTIHVIHANSLEYDKRLGEGAERLIGNVVLADDSTTLYSDSTYSFPDNSFRAFGHVHMSRKDSVDLYGDSLHYSGITRVAEVFGKTIKCLRKGMTLTTKHLIYDIHAHALNYWDGGTIVDSNNTLTSVIGIYNTGEKMCYFKEHVVLVNPKYVIRCDTMLYAPGSRIAIFRGPTRITSKTNFMYCEKGYYNTKDNYCQFWQKPYILNKKGDSLSGEQIYYDRNKDYGQVMDNVSLVDTTDNIILKGDYAEYNGADETMLTTCKALLLQVYNKDTLHLHADTLFGKNISMSDTNKTGKPKLMLAYHHVKFFKKDLSGKCDSLTYDEKDSIMRMFYSPILWSDENQLTADSMRLHFKNKKMDVLNMRGHSFIASKDTLASKLMKEDSLASAENAKDTALVSDSVTHSRHDSLSKDSSHTHHDSLDVNRIAHGGDTLQFNQVKGKNMKGYFKDNKMYKVNVLGNGQTIYYVYTDNNESILGVNRADCSNMTMYITNNKISSITFLQKPDATLFPMKQVKQADFLLGGFHWYESQRPRTINDIFGKNP
jgi:lipopolysaccharide export system protein LptA